MYQKLIDLMPDDGDNYLHIARIYRELHQLDKAEENLLKARQYEPGSLEVMYNEAMLYQAQGRYDDAIRVLADAVTGVKGQSPVLPSRRRSLAILYQQLGQTYQQKQNYAAAIYTYEELGHLGDEEDRRARAADHLRISRSQGFAEGVAGHQGSTGEVSHDPAIKTRQAMLLGENGQPDEAAKLLRAQLTSNNPEADRETYLNLAQVYERTRRYKEAEEAAHAAEVLPGAAAR